ncbi:hypothetical protein HNQ08_000877 [Deinococcus humi]|uniref:Uncharacterized protein n=1 Tax=Deinococcus humi TaxID=662880 RepID=A0A7W8JRC1_9DEIO|nr:hypothetical protein [Deinococcus humi]GGO23667.1 hypothetical protein GCM10008949_12030 [Deinococcus humi]
MRRRKLCTVEHSEVRARLRSPETGLRSVLELSASWVDAHGPAHGWPSGTPRTQPQPWDHRNHTRRAKDSWHLWDLCRWNPGRLGPENNPTDWAELIRTAVLNSATLSDVTGPACPGLLPWDRADR